MNRYVFQTWLAHSDDIWAKIRERTNTYTAWHVQAEGNITSHFEDCKTERWPLTACNSDNIHKVITLATKVVYDIAMGKFTFQCQWYMNKNYIFCPTLHKHIKCSTHQLLISPTFHVSSVCKWTVCRKILYMTFLNACKEGVLAKIKFTK